MATPLDALLQALQDTDWSADLPGPINVANRLEAAEEDLMSMAAQLDSVPPGHPCLPEKSKATLLYSCPTTSRTVCIDDLRTPRSRLESFTRIRLVCAECGEHHIVPACLSFRR
jgi:hypothetical protein